MSRGKRAFSVGAIALAILFAWVGGAAALTTSNSVAATDERAPEAPTELVVDVDLGVPAVLLSWTASPSDAVRQAPVGTDFTSGGTFVNVNDVAAYNIWRSDGTGYELIASVAVAIDDDETVEAGVTYTYQVTAADAGGNESAAIESAPVNLGPPPTAVITAPEILELGVVAIDEIATATIDVANDATLAEAVLTVNLTVEGDGFSTDVETLTIDATSSGSFEVSFSAADVGNLNNIYEGLLVIRTNDPGNRLIIVPLVAEIEDGLSEPVLDLSGVALSFRPTLLGVTRTKTLTVTNKGDLDLEAILSLVDAAGVFSIDAETLDLVAGEAAAVSVVFSPAVTGTFAGSIEITSNDPEKATASVTLSASGVAVVTGPIVGVAADGTEFVGLLDDDDDVDLDDFFVFADAFGQSFGSDTYNAGADFDGDGEITIDDFFQFADGFGKTIGG